MSISEYEVVGFFTKKKKRKKKETSRPARPPYKYLFNTQQNLFCKVVPIPRFEVIRKQVPVKLCNYSSVIIYHKICHLYLHKRWKRKLLFELINMNIFLRIDNMSIQIENINTYIKNLCRSWSYSRHFETGKGWR